MHLNIRQKPSYKCQIIFPISIVRIRFFPVMLFLLGLVIAGQLYAQTLDPGQKEWFDKYKKQKNAPNPEAMLLNTDKEPDLHEGFIPLFNGTDLSGWTAKGGHCEFEAKDGMIIGKCVPKSPSTYLCTDKADFSDFIFTCDMKWKVDGNTGVMFRAKEKAEDDNIVVYGPQAEMENFSRKRYWSGGIYGQSCGGWYYPLWLDAHQEVRTAMKENEWNRLTILAKGNVVKTWVNGIPASNWINDIYLEGFFGLQIHSGKQGTILWRNIRVKEIVD